MRRKYTDSLIQWKKNPHRHPLLLQGLRQTGKTWLALDFAEKNYKNTLYLNLETDKPVADYLSVSRSPQDALLFLETYAEKPLLPSVSLLILDNIQCVPELFTLLAALSLDYPQSHIIAIHRGLASPERYSKNDFHIISLYPLDFEEFLWALDNESLMDFIKVFFEKKKPLGAALHRKAMDYFRQYMIVGGMPQAVERYVETKDFERVDRVKRDILELYRADIVKHAQGYEMKVEQIFDDIPAQLQKHDKKFKLSSLKKEARFRDYEDAIFWLSDAMIVNVCYNSTAPNIGLKLNMDRVTMKCYMADTGLLISHAFDENGIVSEEIYKKLLFDKLEVNKGMIMENIVAQMLVASGHKLYFYNNPSRDDASLRMEIDFLIAKSKITSKHNISPIEVKSGGKYTLTSLKKCREKYTEQLDTLYVLHKNDLKVEEGIVYLPLYMTPLL